MLAPLRADAQGHQDRMRAQDEGVQVEHQHPGRDRPVQELLAESASGMGEAGTHGALRRPIGRQVLREGGVPRLVLTAGHAVEHPLECGLIQQVLLLQPLIVPERYLLAVDGANPRPLDLDLPPR